jgi:uncharacterized protein YsxB (DUF464 family)
VLNLKVKIDKNQILKEIIATGHADHSQKGTDIVCSAASILLYSTVLTLNKVSGTIISNKDDKNDFIIQLKHYSEENIDILKGITIFLVNGLNLLKKKNNENISLYITQNE